jgi:protein ImuB
MSTPVSRPAIEGLRECIRRLEGAAGCRRTVLPFGIKAIDRHLPGGGLALGALHEVAGGGNGAIDGAAAALFAAGIAAREMLEAKGLGARRLDLFFHRVDNRIEAIRIGTARPVRDIIHLTRLLCDKIESIDPAFGVEILRLAATRTEPLAPKQMGSRLTEKPEADVSGLIDTLANRVGEQHLYRFAPVESDVVERTVQKIAPVSPNTGQTWRDPWPRPARLLPRPEPIDTLALLPDHPPVSFTWRGIRRRVKCADGPERIFGEWWKRDTELSAVRDYFRVEDEAGERFWIYRSGDGEDTTTGSHKWFLHGIFG